MFLFDEPLSNLDAELRVQMRVEIARLHAELGVTMIYVTHDQVEAMTLADRIVVLRDGRIEQIGRPLDLYDDPANQFVAGFVGSPRMNFMAAEVVARDRAGLTVALVNQGGARLDLLPPLAGVDAGDRLTVGVRPEHFLPRGPGRLRPRPSRSTSPSILAPPATSTPTPRRRAADRRARGSRAELGDRLTVSIPARRAYLFDAEGVRLK